MWALILVTVTWGSNNAPSITHIDGFRTQQACVEAVKFSKARSKISDAWCVAK